MEITSVTNPRVKLWAQLLDKKGREKQGKFMVEGIHLVLEALQSQALIESIVYSIDEGIPDPIQQDEFPHIEWIGVSSSVIAKCSDTVTPQGIFAIIHKLSSDLSTLIQDSCPLVIVIDGIQDPGNLGTIIRSADAVGATGVVIGQGSVDLYNPKTIRATMGSVFHLPIVEADLGILLPEVRELPINIVSTSLQAQANCYQEDFTKGAWIIVGNEGQGVSSRISSFVNREVMIPMKGQAESLNVAMATTVLLYEALRQRSYT